MRRKRTDEAHGHYRGGRRALEPTCDQSDLEKEKGLSSKACGVDVVIEACNNHRSLVRLKRM